jgi:hypothetical protein
MTCECFPKDLNEFLIFWVYFKVFINSCKYCLFTNSDFVVLVKQKIWNINNKHNICLDMWLYLHMNILYCILQCFSPDNTHINLPNFSLVFLANHAMFTFIIVKLHFVTLSPHNTYIAFPDFSLVFGWLCNIPIHNC